MTPHWYAATPQTLCGNRDIWVRAPIVVDDPEFPPKNLNSGGATGV
jgi:hypothetical protein